MTDIVISCPRCGHHLHLPDRSFVGRKGKCPQCEVKFVMEERFAVDEAEAARAADQPPQPDSTQPISTAPEPDAGPLRSESRPTAASRPVATQPAEPAASPAETDSSGDPTADGETVEPDPAIVETYLNPAPGEPASSAQLSDDDDDVAADLTGTAGGEALIALESGPDNDRPDNDRPVDVDDTADLSNVDDDEPPPEQLGRYRVLKQIGRGSMGAVYLAHDTELDRQVALKIPQFSEREQSNEKERFHREARAAATLRHPNICQVFDIGEVDGTHFIAMQYIEGNPLRLFIQQARPQPVRKIAGTLLKLARALQAAHDKGLVHRDLKPDNIMIGQRGEPVIMDFGLVRLMDDDNQITSNGALVGSPAYMSPEQIEGEPGAVGPPSDMFSLGVVAYELLTRRRPFRGNLSELFDQIAGTDPPAPSSLRGDVDPAFESICLKMMAKSAGDRYRSMSHLADALSDYLEQTASASRKNGPSPVAAPAPHAASAGDPSPASTTGEIPPDVPAPSSPDEAAAHWVLKIGGALKVATADNSSLSVPDAAGLPAPPYRVIDVGLLKNQQSDDDSLHHLRELQGLRVLRLSETGVTDAGLAHLAGLAALQVLDLSSTGITDAGLKQLKGLKGLKQLDLANTRVTDAGLPYLKRLKGLQFLGLHATRVTDAGLKTVAGLKNLQFLVLYGTEVSDAGVTRLKKSLKNCTISR